MNQVVEMKEYPVMPSMEPLLDVTKPESVKLLENTIKVLEDRCKQYGGSNESFNRIAVGWTEILEVEFKKYGRITARGVAKAMIWMKVCRDSVTEKDDNMIDICGYASLTKDIS